MRHFAAVAATPSGDFFQLTEPMVEVLIQPGLFEVFGVHNVGDEFGVKSL